MKRESCVATMLDNIQRILSDIKYSELDFFKIVEDILVDMRSRRFTQKKLVSEYLCKQDGFNQYWSFLEKITCRKWRHEEVLRLWMDANKSQKRKRDRIPLMHRLYLALEKPSHCFVCGSKDNLEIHHKNPVSRGGKNALGNYEWCCPKCNKEINNKRINVGG